MPLSLSRRVRAPGAVLRAVAAAAAMLVVSDLARAQTTAPVPLSGVWTVTIHQEPMALVVPMTFRTWADGRWEAYSRAGAAGRLVGRSQALLGGVLGKLPPHGALTRVEQGTSTPLGDTLRIRGTFASSVLGDRYLTGTVVGGGLTAELRRDSAGPVVATLSGVPAADTARVRDYPALAREIRRAFTESVYDPRLVESDAWRGFFDALDARFARVHDDAEAMAAFYLLKPRLGTSHVELVRAPGLAALPFDTLLERTEASDAGVTLSYPAPGVAYLRIRRWHQATAAVDSAFVRIDSARAHTLVLDVRGNPGGDATSISPATHLLADSTIVGVFLGRRWYSAHPAPPTRAEMAGLTVLSNDGGASTVLYGVRQHGAVVGLMTPRAPRFGGRVFLLVDRRSASASEPLAYLLRSTGRATLVGESTAGAMLAAPPHPVGQGWLLTLPEADYFAVDGTRLEGRGVAPHVTTRPVDALGVVADSLIAAHPYAAAMVRGAARAEAARYAEGAAAYAEAHRLEPDSLAPLRAAGLVQQAAKEWDAAFAAWASILARVPADAAALYQVGRTAALSGREPARGEAALRAYLAQPHQAGLPGFAQAHWRLGQILEAGGRAAEARVEFQEAARLEPENADFRAAVARTAR
jgi:hypothetical protein